MDRPKVVYVVECCRVIDSMWWVDHVYLMRPDADEYVKVSTEGESYGYRYRIRPEALR